MTHREMKRRGFDLYYRCKKESNALFAEIKEMNHELREEQIEALRAQDEKMQARVETRLEEIQEDFLKKTKAAAQTIFEENHAIVFG